MLNNTSSLLVLAQFVRPPPVLRALSNALSLHPSGTTTFGELELHVRASTAMLPTGTFLTTGSFSYRKLKKLPASPHDQQQQQQKPPPSATSIFQDAYHSYYRALGAAVARRRARGRRRGGRPPRLRISSLARALRRKAAAVGGRVRASVAKVAARLVEGRPYIGDLFAGNYVFMQVAPSAGAGDKGFVPFTEYNYGKVKIGSRPAAGAVQLHPAADAMQAQ